MSTKGGYNHLARQFDRTPFRTPEAVLERVAAHVARGPRPACLVDLCCGTGAVLEHLAPHVDAIVGVDFSGGMLGVAAERLAGHRGRLTLIEADVRAFAPGPLAGTADLVTCFGAFGHLVGSEQQVLLELVRNLLRPGGRFVFVTGPVPRPTERAFWLGHGFNAVMAVRNWLFTPPFVMVYLNFPLPHALAACEAAGLDPVVVPLGWPERPDLALVEATRTE